MGVETVIVGPQKLHLKYQNAEVGFEKQLNSSIQQSFISLLIAADKLFSGYISRGKTYLICSSRA